MKHSGTLISLVALVLFTSACSTLPDDWGKPSCGLNQTVGVIVGAGVGGLMGNQFGKGKGNILATILGAGIGATAGSQAGNSLDCPGKQAPPRYQEWKPN